MTTPTSASTHDSASELKMIRWKQARFAEITSVVEEALPELLTQIEETVAAMTTIRVSKAQVFSDDIWKELFEPWALRTATFVEAQMEQEIQELVASASESGSLEQALRVARPGMAGAGLLAASVAAIPAIISLATVSTTSFFVFTTTSISWPILAVGGAGLAATTFAGGSGVKWLGDKNRLHLVQRLQQRAITAGLGYGRSLRERSLVTDLQVATLRSLDANLEAI